LIIISSFFSCKKEIVSDNYTPKYTSLQLLQKLERVYKTKSVDSLNLFLSEWHNSIPASNKDYIEQNDTIKNIYQLFYDAYQPFKFANTDATNYFGNYYKYIIIQSYISYKVVSNKDFANIKHDLLSEDLQLDSLTNFRPQIKNTKARYLYLTKEYEAAIDSFLGHKHSNAGEEDIMNTAYPEGESYNRYMFLTPTLPIVEGHWGGYWHIATFPIVYSVIFNQDFKNSLIDFRIGVGQTICRYELKKVDGVWKPGDNKQIWMTQE
jgi:hypothetical protein